MSYNVLLDGTCTPSFGCPPGTRARRVFGLPTNCVIGDQVKVALLEEIACERT